MPRTPLKATKTLAGVLRNRRLELGLTHRDVEARTAEMGDRIPFATLARVEEGVQEVGFRRLHALMRLYQLPFEVLPDLMELENLAAPMPVERDPEVLYRRGLEHWKRGEFGQGLGHLIALRVLAPDTPDGRLQRQKGMLSLAIASNRLGRTKLAHRTVEQLLIEPPDPSLLVHALIQSAVCWTGLGSLDVALGILARAEQLADSQDARLHALIAHQRARIFVLGRELDAADESIEAALRGYRRAKDEENRVAATWIRIDIEMLRGRFDRALETAKKAHAAAVEHGFAPLAARRRLDIGRALLAMEQLEPARQAFTDALGQAVALGDGELRFFAHYWLHKLHHKLGQKEQADFELHAARHYLRFVHDGSDESKEIRRGAEGSTDVPSAHRAARRRR